MLRVPFRFLEGCLIAAHAIQSVHVFIYIRGEYEQEFEVLRDSLAAMRRQTAARERHVRAPPRRRRVHLRRGDGAARVSGGPARPTADEAAVPGDRGLYAAPTAVNNVESITSATSVLELGGEAYAKLGVPNSTGTRVFSLSGNVVNGGNYELPHGFPLKDLIYEVGGGIAGGRTLKAVIPGGSSTVVLTAEEAEGATLDFDSLTSLGTAIGSAAVIAIDDRCCMVQLGIRVSQFYEHESCGKCTPCRVGTRWLTQILQKIEEGRAAQADFDLLLDVCDRILGKCLCPLGDSDAIAVASYVDKFRDEFQAHIDHGGCPLAGGSSLEDILAPVAMHGASPVGKALTGVGHG